MTFVVILIALAIERFFDWTQLGRWQWYAAYQQMIAKRLIGKSPYLTLAAVVLPLFILTLLVSCLLRSSFYGLGWMIFALAVLMYCLGPKNLWADTYACIAALGQGDRQAAAETLRNHFGLIDSGAPDQWHFALINQIFVAANTRVFAVVFWFVLLGPAGAVLYRTLNLSSVEKSEISAAAAFSQSILDFLPARLLTFLFALGGHFSRVFAIWRKMVMHGLDSSEALLKECGTAGIDDAEKSAQDGVAEKSALSLIDRALIITLVIIPLGLCLVLFL